MDSNHLIFGKINPEIITGYENIRDNLGKVKIIDARWRILEVQFVLLNQDILLSILIGVKISKKMVLSKMMRNYQKCMNPKVNRYLLSRGI